MEQYLIDTNVVSDYFTGAFSNNGMLFMDTVINAILNLSIITQIELLCWNKDAFTEQKVKGFIADSVLLDISSDVISHCVNIRKSKKIKTPDAIIASTALANNFTLITNNEKDFNNIKDLKLINPFSI